MPDLHDWIGRLLIVLILAIGALGIAAEWLDYREQQADDGMAWTGAENVTDSGEAPPIEFYQPDEDATLWRCVCLPPPEEPIADRARRRGHWHLRLRHRGRGGDESDRPCSGRARVRPLRAAGGNPMNDPTEGLTTRVSKVAERMARMGDGTSEWTPSVDEEVDVGCAYLRLLEDAKAAVHWTGSGPYLGPGHSPGNRLCATILELEGVEIRGQERPMTGPIEKARGLLERQPGDDNYLSNSRQVARWLHIAEAALDCLEEMSQVEVLYRLNSITRDEFQQAVDKAKRKFEEAICGGR
jgi:hypothetical protein